MRNLNRLIGAALAVASVSSALAQSDTDMAKRLKEMYPATTFTAVRQADVVGLYEVVMGRNVAFTDKSGRFFVFGHLFDMKEQKDLTAERLSDVGRVDFGKLPLHDAITVVRGDGTRKIAVFSDPECPYCKRLDGELAKLDNVTIHTFLYPLDGLHPEARGKAERIWCARNPAKAWDDFMASGKVPESAKCETPVERNVKLGGVLGITGTPTLIFENGSLVAGALSAAELEKRLGSLVGAAATSGKGN